MTCAEAVAQAIARETTGVLFAVLGGPNAFAVIEPCRQEEIACILARSEHGALAMADGYFRATGHPGVCFLDRGLGESNCATSLATAVRRRSSVVVLTSAAVDAALASALGAAEVPLLSRSADAVAQSLHTAFRIARLGTPVVVSRFGDLADELPGRFDYRPASDALPIPQRPRPDPESIRKAVDILRESRRHIFIAGRGAGLSGASVEIARLAQRLGGLLSTSYQGKDLFSGISESVGFAGGTATDLGKDLFRQADCVVAFGAGLNVYTTQGGALFPCARVIQIDVDLRRIAEASNISLGVVADAKAAAVALYEALGSDPERTPWFDVAAAMQEVPPTTFTSSVDGLDPREVVAILDEVLPTARSVVTDGGHFRSFVIDGLRTPGPEAFHDCVDFGAISVSLPLSIGVALGDRERRCVACMGDGGFSMTLQELETVARYNIPLTIVIFDDSAYGGELRQLEIKEQPVDVMLFDNPDFSSVARAVGLRGQRITEPAQLRQSLTEMQVPDGPPVVLDVIVSRSVKFRYHPIVDQLRREREATRATASLRPR